MGEQGLATYSGLQKCLTIPPIWETRTWPLIPGFRHALQSPGMASNMEEQGLVTYSVLQNLVRVMHHVPTTMHYILQVTHSIPTLMHSIPTLTHSIFKRMYSTLKPMHCTLKKCATAEHLHNPSQKKCTRNTDRCTTTRGWHTPALN